MKALNQQLLNNFQSEFPLNPRPFDQIARELDTSSATVMEQLRELQVKGVVSRVGPVFRPNTIGVSTLAAMAVPAAELEKVAAIVNGFPQVNHNYEREHRYNLWFVATAGDRHTLKDTLTEITARSGHDVMSLPLLKDYHIDLGFHMPLDRQPGLAELPDIPPDADDAQEAQGTSGSAEDLIEAIQCGLPLVPRPYREIARQLGCCEDEVIEALREMLSNGTIKRLGVVVRHHELGYRANAMVVWDVPDQQVDRLGRLLGDQDCITLCYQRPRRLPDWPYNLFCMVHGRDRDEVMACIERMATALDIGDLPHEVLFSVRRFRQRGARYRTRR